MRLVIVPPFREDSGEWSALPQPETAPAGRRRRSWWKWVAAASVGLLLFAGAVLLGSGYRTLPSDTLVASIDIAGTTDLAREVGRARTEQRRLQARLQALRPQGNHIVIDQGNNRLYLRRGAETLLEAVCSSGSGMVLRDHQGERSWVFDTPRGAFAVKTKLRDPIWRKPDWAFVEEGKPIPKDPGERFEAGVLGEYGLSFGDGFLIHGTLYERLLGRGVTHGCIRLGRDDLRQVAAVATIGTPIYIF
jgi:L,D-transpeptidase YbiS